MVSKREVDEFIHQQTAGWTPEQRGAALQYFIRNMDPKAQFGGELFHLVWNEAVRAAGVIPMVSITVH